MNEDLREAGRIPYTMEVELTADLGQCAVVLCRYFFKVKV